MLLFLSVTVLISSILSEIITPLTSEAFLFTMDVSRISALPRLLSLSMKSWRSRRLSRSTSTSLKRTPMTTGLPTLKASMARMPWFISMSLALPIMVSIPRRRRSLLLPPIRRENLSSSSAVCLPFLPSMLISKRLMGARNSIMPICSSRKSMTLAVKLRKVLLTMILSSLSRSRLISATRKSRRTTNS